ncbi:TetR/AcrR family transcriptional regulator [Streptomyces pactum]|uniref:TetR/AcrR family transcriptional regulator n=1 Tax=Streptomyces pactum TaxID=68249 RepID=UPI0027DB1F85|nr:TetR/AcrR family transcriptional regulator [Streptomyces pactum]
MSSPAAGTPRGTGPTRTDRRRARTRGALVAAARAILSDQGPADVSIQQITNCADVGFGSFYNHFSSKAELFEAAVADAAEEYGTLLDDSTAGLTDPAEQFAVGVRITGGLPDTHPQLARILMRTGLVSMRAGSVLPPRALGLIVRGMDAGRFRVADPHVALAGVAGCLLGLVELRMAPAGDGFGALGGLNGLDALDGLDGELRGQEDICEQMAELMLRMLGMPAEEAAEVARRPLPAARWGGGAVPVPAVAGARDEAGPAAAAR